MIEQHIQRHWQYTYAGVTRRIQTCVLGAVALACLGLSSGPVDTTAAHALAHSDGGNVAAAPVAGVPSGALIVDPDNAHFIVYNRDANHDGLLDPFYLAGVGSPEGFLYESDARKQYIVDQLRTKGGNGIYFHAVRAFGGDGGHDENPFINNDPEQGLDPAILDNWDYYLTQLDNAGIALFFFLYDDGSTPFGCATPPRASEKSFIQTLVDRFKSKKHLIWVTQEEYNSLGACPGMARHKALAAVIRQYDSYHPIGVHHMNGQGMQFAGDANITVYLQQAGDHQGRRDDFDGRGVEAMHNSAGKVGWGNWVYVMSEAYPWHGDLLHDQDRTTLRQSHWATALAGGYVLMYNAYECQEKAKLCGMNPPASADPHDPTLDMLKDLKRLQRFMESTRFHRLAPADYRRFGDTKWVLANSAQRRFILYSNDAPENLGVKRLAAGSYHLSWFDPIDGSSSTQTVTFHGLGNRTFATPSHIASEAVVYITPTTP